jgi:type IV pilus assembly protein PilW
MLSSMRKPGCNMASRGFSLVELMLAMVIGLIIIGGVMSLYITTRDTQRSSEDQLQLLSDARFVINTIGDDLRQAGYWGEAAVTTSIVCRNGDATCTGSDALAPATDDCAAGWYIDLMNAVIASDNTNNYSTCTSASYKANTDVLGIHYADSNVVLTTSLAANVAYIRSNYDVGGLFIGDTIPTSTPYDGLKYWTNTAANNARSENRKLVSNLYYVSDDTVAGDGIPSLHKVELESGPVMNDEMLISGVADLQFQFGVDTSTPRDGSVNSYVEAGSIPTNATTGATDWSSVRSVKIWVLMRSGRKDKDIPIAGTQTFTLANNTDSPTDGHQYYMVTNTIYLRNNK